MSVLVEMKVAGWSWALLPKAPHSFWSYQQKSLLFQQWFPWQCSQSRKGKKKSQWHFKCELYWKKMFSSEENTWSSSIAEVTAAEYRAGFSRQGGGTTRWCHAQTPCTVGKKLEGWSRCPGSAAQLRAGTWTPDWTSYCGQRHTATPRATGRIKACSLPSPISLSIFHLTKARHSQHARLHA